MQGINLLSPADKEYIKQKKILFIVKQISFQVLSIFLIVGAVFFFINLILSTRLDSLKKQVENEQQLLKRDSVQSLEESTKQLNSQLAKASAIQKEYIKWTDKLIELSKLINEGVSLKEIDFDTENKTFIITGVANDRPSLLTLEDNLKNSPFFINISIPISDLIKKEDINFKMNSSLANNFYE